VLAGGNAGEHGPAPVIADPGRPAQGIRAG